MAPRLPVLDIRRDPVDDGRGGPVADCGHVVQEEQPAAFLDRLPEFLPAPS